MKAEGVAGVVAPSSYVVGFAVLEWGWCIVRGVVWEIDKTICSSLSAATATTAGRYLLP